LVHMDEQVVYVYGIAAGPLDLARAPHGVDEAAVQGEEEGGLTALCSLLDAGTYAGGEAEARAGDVEWIGPRAVAHDSVLTWASDSVDVVPFPMLTLFSSSAALRDMLRERRASLVQTLGRVKGAREYTLRVFQTGGSVADDVLARISPRVAELERLAAAAAPGQRYLLERKLERARRDERVIADASVASEVASELSAHATEMARSPLPASSTGSEGRAVLDASFLVQRDQLDGFSAAVSALAQRHEPSGFRFEFTGPWPAYHFTRTSD
jgi:hypothetical protein